MADARALTVLVDELWALYRDPEAALPPVVLTMPRYVAAVQRRRRVAVVQSQKEEAFWCARCDREPEDGGLPPPPQLPLAANYSSSSNNLGAVSEQHGDISRLSSSIARTSGGASAPFAAPRG